MISEFNDVMTCKGDGIRKNITTNYYSIENILKPTFGCKLQSTNFSDKTSNESQELKSVESSESETITSTLTDSPLKNSMKFLENFFKTNYKFVTALNDSFSPKSKDSAEKLRSLDKDSKAINGENPSSCLDAAKNRKRSLANSTTAPSSKSLVLPPDPIPAWIFCTRYSDRPSSGTRIKRKGKKNVKQKFTPSELFSPINKFIDKAAIKNHGQEADVNPFIHEAPYQSTDENSIESNYGRMLDEFAGDPNKRPRTAFSHSQLHRLRKEFNANPYLTETRRRDLAQGLGLKESQIKIWFQNKRAKLKKKKSTVSMTEATSPYPSGVNACRSADPRTVIVPSDAPLGTKGKERSHLGPDERYAFMEEEEELDYPQKLVAHKNGVEKNYLDAFEYGSETERSLRSDSPLTLLNGKFAGKPSPSSSPQKSILTTPPGSPGVESISSNQLTSPVSPEGNNENKSSDMESQENFLCPNYFSMPHFKNIYGDSYNHRVMTQILNKYPTINNASYENFYYFMPFLPHTYHHSSTINNNGLK